MTTIKIRPNGPYVIDVTDGPDGNDVNVVDWNGVAYPITRRPIALCRCGASANKPFCDRSHARIGFAASEAAVADPSDDPAG